MEMLWFLIYFTPSILLTLQRFRCGARTPLVWISLGLPVPPQRVIAPCHAWSQHVVGVRPGEVR